MVDKQIGGDGFAAAGRAENQDAQRIGFVQVAVEECGVAGFERHQIFVVEMPVGTLPGVRGYRKARSA